jgi:hypothetical protein
MCYTANTREGASCIALAWSSDLREWTDAGPILVGPSEGYEPDLQGRHPQGSLESALLVNRLERWLIVVNAARRGTAARTWMVASDRVDSFDFAQARPFWSDAGLVELVREKGSRALIAGVRQGTLRLGVVDWAEEQPAARSLAAAAELTEWV